MKKILLLLLTAVIFGSAPLACTRNFTVMPGWVPTSTPTSTPTPACGFINLFAWGVTPVPTDTPTVTPTWNPSLPSPTPTITPFPPFPTKTPVITYPNIPLGGNVIRTLTDWTALYGTTPPPAGLNFSTQMILVMTFPGCCAGLAGFENVCVTASQVEVSLFYGMGKPPCGAICLVPQTIIVPQSSLPVVVTKMINY